MSLAVSGKHSLDDMEKWVTEKFSPVENKNVEVPNLGEPEIWPGERCGQLIKHVPVQDKDIMAFCFVLPHVEYEVLSTPLSYFSHLFGHEGENSLLSYLISEGLALELSAGGDHEMHAYSSFSIEVTLTKKGLAEQERVVEAVFQYA
jgi:insulysin